MLGLQEDKVRKEHWLGVDGRQQCALAGCDMKVSQLCPLWLGSSGLPCAEH